MADVYASAVGTTVLQIAEIPPRPAEFDGAVCLFGVGNTVTEEHVRGALTRYGEIVSVDLSGPLRAQQGAVVVWFSTHKAALEAKRGGATDGLCDGAIDGLCKGIDMLYNERSYGGRHGEGGRAADDGRGWSALPYTSLL
eukprot:3189226-Prymnesium_polylepis.1